MCGDAGLLADPQLADRGFFHTVRDPVLGQDVTYPGPPYRLPDHRLPDWAPAPAPGDHTDAVLRDWLGDWLGAAPERLAALRAELGAEPRG